MRDILSCKNCWTVTYMSERLEYGVSIVPGYRLDSLFFVFGKLYVTTRSTLPRSWDSILNSF